jgi:hypothetical protein
MQQNVCGISKSMTQNEYWTFLDLVTITGSARLFIT